MKPLADEKIKHLFCALTIAWGVVLLLTEGWLIFSYGSGSIPVLLLFLLAWVVTLALCGRCIEKQNALIEGAITQINAYLGGDTTARIDCDREGTLYRLFHSINALAAVLNAHADNELREKEFLKNTISDISHQLKTPLAALNIYNGLIQEADIDPASVKEFATLSEQELDRIETLVKNLLKITKLDAGTIVPEKNPENVADMLRDSQARFAYRASEEEKEIFLSGPEEAMLLCDRGWLREAIDNLIKNALDHTKAGDAVCLEWKILPGAVQICVRDNGAGIHPEDLYHIFKRFYRSRFSQDTQGLGLGLPLAKAIVEANGGTIEVESDFGKGTVFTMSFPIPTKL